MKPHGRHANDNRRAVVTMSLLVCLAIAMMLMMGWAKMLMLENRHVRAQQARLQAEYMARSAMARAAARAAVDGEYVGETWKAGGGAVTIEVARVDGQPRARRVHVEARLVDGLVRSASHTAESTIELGNLGEAP